MAILIAGLVLALISCAIYGRCKTGGNTVMGSIDLDPASCEIANETVRATTYGWRALPW